MGSTTKPREVVGFHFEEIPLDEAVNAVIAGDGNYAEIKAKLLEALPNLPEGKAFAFGLPNGKEVDEDQRRGLCMACNGVLKKAKLPWRVTYSGTKKLFVCVPKSVPAYQKRSGHEGYTPRSKWNNIDNSAILELWNSGMSVNKIVEKLGEDPQRVQYVCYQLNPRRPRPLPPTHPGPGKMEDKKAEVVLHSLIAKAMRLFKVSQEDIRSPLTQKGKAIRKAICVVAVERNIAPRMVAPYVGITQSGVKFNAQQKTQFAKEEIEKLRGAE